MVTGAEFDALLAVSSWPDAPSASAICKRLQSGWRMVVSLAFDSGRDWAKTIGKRRREEQIKGLSDEEISQAIRFVSLTTGCGEAPRPAVYESVREAAVSADRRRWMYGGMQALLLPNSEQIIHAAGSWARAVEISGLGPLGRAAARDVTPIVDVLDAYVEETGTLAPVDWTVEEWRRKRGGRVAGSTLPQKAYFAELRVRRAARGLETPPPDVRGVSHAALSPASGTEYAPRPRWAWATCVELLARLLLELPPGTRSVTHTAS